MGRLPRSPRHKVLGDATCVYEHRETLLFKPKWYFTKAEIEEYSPSRKDGIECEKESHLRQLYCSYLQKLGMELKVPQVTIATAMMLCHRFYMHQSHAKNCWQTVATASMFLACKTEDTPRLLKDLISVAYKLMYNWDPSAPQKIRQKEVYDKQKQLIVLGERLILGTIAFDLNIEHPYKPLVAALKKLEISQNEVVKVAWNFVNDWLRTTLCLQYKPHYVAAGSIFLAAKFHKIKLPSANGKVWWMQFDVSPQQLEEVIQHMLQLLGQSSKQALPISHEARTETKPVAGKRKSDSTEYSMPIGTMAEQDSRNCSMENASVLSKPIAMQCNQKQPHNNISGTEQKTEKCQITDSSGSANSVVEDGDGEQITGDSNQKSSCKIVSIKECCQKIDVTRIRERLKRRKLNRLENNKSDCSLEDEINSEAWIQSELEKGIVLV